jgi:signal transduction histidine kinase/CheY-like chemotaxis protein
MRAIDEGSVDPSGQKSLTTSLSRRIILLSVALVLSLIVTMSISYVLNTNATALEKDWREYNLNYNDAREALFNVLEHSGYGAFIHNFKNYVLRGDKQYLDNAERNVVRVKQDIERLKGNLSDPNDKLLIDQIIHTFDKYFEKLTLAKSLRTENLSIAELDKQLRVDDSAALDAIALLKNKLDHEYTLQLENTTQAIDFYKSISYYLYTLMLPILLVYLVGLYVSYANYKIALKSLALADEANIARKTQAEFLANMSHEIRTPMNGILGMFRLLSDTSLNVRQSHLVEQGIHSGRALLTVINDILDISKIESGKIHLKPTEFSLESTLVDVGRLLQSNIGEKPIELLCPTAPIISPPLIGDATRLRQILINLIGNAIKFTHKGTIKVSATIEKSKTTSNVTFTVEDTGIGIAQDDLMDIFARFEQVDNSLTRTIKGTGLGLTITKELVSLMGGEISVESVINEGTRFSFTLPFDIDQTKPPEMTFSPFEHCQALIYFAEEDYQGFIKTMIDTWQVQASVINNLDDIDRLTPSKDKNITTILIAKPSLISDKEYQAISHILKDKAIHIIWITDLLKSTIYIEAKDREKECVLVKPIAPSELYNAIVRCNGEYWLSEKNNVSDTGEMNTFSGNILLVEDDLINQEVAKALLSKFGLNITVAENGEVALMLLQINKYDLILMDCMMPVMDGFTATEKLRAGDAGEKNRDTTIIALTADAMEGTAEKCLNAGMNDYLTKPLEPADLAIKLSKWLDNSSD